jgi:hypothetical protein
MHLIDRAFSEVARRLLLALGMRSARDRERKAQYTEGLRMGEKSEWRTFRSASHGPVNQTTLAVRKSS